MPASAGPRRLGPSAVVMWQAVQYRRKTFSPSAASAASAGAEAVIRNAATAANPALFIVGISQYLRVDIRDNAPLSTVLPLRLGDARTAALPRKRAPRAAPARPRASVPPDAGRWAGPPWSGRRARWPPAGGSC